ncbi:MAG TPA: efflux transporter outer membrane subunit [Kofleriaceae bacterium]|jgi:NodT family efflux transporter outer membrane factor (OMF) lipoprotein|nr:efflux transporter outer membrane subunit [Kofleriaceae bacterium]
MTGALRRAIALAALAGCTVGPAYHVPPAPLPGTPGYKETVGGPWRVAQPADAMLRGAWWRVFGEPELDALEAQLRTGNQTIAQAVANLDAARAQIRAAQAAYYPTLTASPSVVTGRSGGGGVGSFVSTGTGTTGTTGTTTGTTAGTGTGTTGTTGGSGASGTTGGSGASGVGTIGGGGGGRFTSYSLPIDASWAPDLFGRVRNTVRQARSSAQASAADLAGQELLEQATLAATYFQLRGQDALQELLDATVAADQWIYELARARFETGVDTEVAVVQAEQTLQAARVQATSAGILRAQYEHAIATLIGRPATAFSLARRARLTAPPAIPTGAPSRLLERRPDIAGAERRMAAANATIGIGYAAYYPDLTLSGAGGLASTAISSLLSWPSRFWSVGATVSEMVFDGGLRRANIDQARAAYNASVAAYRQTVLAAFQQVEDALAQTRILGHEIEQQRRTVELAGRAFELEQARYESGIDPYINLMQEQALLLEARQTLVGLEVQHMTSAVALVEALGGGWQRSELSAHDRR